MCAPVAVHFSLNVHMPCELCAGPPNPDNAMNACGGKCCDKSKGYECVLETNDGSKDDDYYCCANFTTQTLDITLSLTRALARLPAVCQRM